MRRPATVTVTRGQPAETSPIPPAATTGSKYRLSLVDAKPGLYQHARARPRRRTLTYTLAGDSFPDTPR